MSQVISFGMGGAPPAGFIATLTGNTGGAVPPTAQNINVVGDGTLITIAGNPGTSTLTASIVDSATLGQLIIAGGGAGAAWASLTSANGSITITPGVNTLNIQTSGTSLLNYTDVAVTPYVVQPTDEYLSVDTSIGGIGIEFPNAPATGRVYIVKDRAGLAFANNIAVTTVGGVKTFDGLTTYTMNAPFQAIQIIYNGADYEIF